MFTLLLTIFAAEAHDLNKKYDWETTPAIEICPQANVNIEQVYIALNYWKNKVGFRYSRISRVEKCVKEKINTIQITDDENVDTSKHLGLTTVYSYHYIGSNKKYAEYALVRLSNIPQYDYLQQDLVTHEIGHAIGYGHSDSGVMHHSLGH